MFTAKLEKSLALFIFSSLWIALLAAQPALANERWVSEGDLRELVDQASLPAGSTVEVSYDSTDPRLGADECPAALFTNSEGRRVWGRTLLKVQCVGSATAPFFIHVDFKVWAPVLVVNAQIQRDEPIGRDKVEMRTMDLTQLSSGWMTELPHLDGKTASRPLWPGTLLTHDQLKGQPLMKYGDTVKILIKGQGFQIAGSGVSMETGEMGEIVKIKTPQGKVLHGVAVDQMVVEVTL